LTGSSAANVVTTGSFTIPAMREAGYRGHFAAGVEACASCGGQLTPPIMGSAAFIMMEFIGVSYVEVMRVSIIPAFVYFLACFAMVDLEARRTGLRPMPSADLPRVTDVLRRRGYLLLAVFALLYYLFEGYTPSTAAFWAITYLACLVVMFDEETRRWWNYLIVFPAGAVLFGLYYGTIINGVSGGLAIAAVVPLVIDHRIRVRIVKVVWEAMVEAPKLIAPVTVACAVGGIIVGSITLTGLGERMSIIVLKLGGGYLLLTLFFTMIMAVFLGMGMPTSGAYIVLATLLVPALLQMLQPSYEVMLGVGPGEAQTIAMISAHMFIIYCASKSSLTPPVAIASYAAAAVANTDPWKTSMTAFRIGLPIFIIPYMFVYGPQLLWYGDPLGIVWATVTACVGVWIMSVGCIGWLLVPIGWVGRVIALGASLSLMFAEWRSDVVGFALLAGLVGFCVFRRRQMLARGEAPVYLRGDMMEDAPSGAGEKSPGA
jgi:TRAP transporter 4TM/12TM fusion protein